MDLEGIVAKWKSAPYRMDGSRTSWVKIKNPHYSQAEGRGELFEKFHSPHDTQAARCNSRLRGRKKNPEPPEGHNRRGPLWNEAAFYFFGTRQDSSTIAVIGKLSAPVSKMTSSTPSISN